jgi:hypothetical protein
MFDTTFICLFINCLCTKYDIPTCQVSVVISTGRQIADRFHAAALILVLILPKMDPLSERTENLLAYNTKLENPMLNITCVIVISAVCAVEHCCFGCRKWNSMMPIGLKACDESVFLN